MHGTKQIDGLGELLRAGTAGKQELLALERYRSRFHAARASIEHELLAFGYPVTGRSSKSTLSIVEKLRRTRLRLSQMQDIAGCRAIVPGCAEQDMLCRELHSRIDVRRVVDRRLEPSHGYRAIHVIARAEGMLVEIQLRTLLQHLWAELSEALADAHGQGLKYGTGDRSLLQPLMRLSEVLADIDLPDHTRTARETTGLLHHAEVLFAALQERLP